MSPDAGKDLFEMIADSFLRALWMALAMRWEILWPLILGFALSAAVQSCPIAK